MILDYDAGRFWLQLFSSLASLAAMAGVIFLARMKANAGRIDAIEQRVREAEICLSAMPDKEAVKKLERDLATLAREMSSTTATMERIGQSLGRIEDYLLNERRERRA